MRRNVAWVGLTVAVFLAVLVALPVPAGAVLSGTNGRIVFTSGRDSADGNDAEAKLYLRTVIGSVGGGVAGPTITPTGVVQHRHPTWSPDRTKIAYARGLPGSATTENFDIYIHDIATGVATPITSTLDSLSADRPAWSPDGTRIAYEHQPTDNSAERDIRVHTVANGNTLDLTTGAPIEGKPAWTPDSQTIYYSSGDPNVNADILREPAGGGMASFGVPDSGISEFQPSISPDGTKICFTLGQGFNGTADVFTAPLATPASQTNLSDNVGTMPQHGDYNCTWSPDGTLIAYVTGTFTVGALVMERSDDTSLGPLSLEDNANNFDGNPDWAPDGRPTCQDATVNVVVNTPTSIPLACADNGPQYEQTAIIVDIPPDAQPANGAVGDVQQGSPASVTYTPNANFTGTDSFQARVRDGVAFGTQRATITLNVAPPGANDTVAPSFAGTPRADPRTFEVNRTGKRETAVSAAKGTTFRYSLSETATVTFRIERKTVGRRVSGRCRKATRQNRARRKCTLYRRAGAFRSAAASGKNSKRFSGRIGRRNLKRGSHRAVLTAVDAAGNRSKQARAAFRVVAAKRAR